MMYGLTSIFKNELGDYLALKQKTCVPRSFNAIRYMLRHFDSYIAQISPPEKAVTEEIINGWIRSLPQSNSKTTVHNKVCCIRKFLEYLRACGYTTFSPTLPRYSSDYVPYIYSDEEVEKIFAAADNLAPTKGRPTTRYTMRTFPMLLRLLYGCGLRLGETLMLRIRDIDFANGTLRLIHTKDKKERIVPMHRELADILERYSRAMRRGKKPDAFLFPKDESGIPLSMQSAESVFRKILIASGVYVPPDTPGKRGQCLHCFRHLFAVKSFAQGVAHGRSIDDSVPFLSVYLGHFDMDGTEKYLRFDSDMFPEYTDMFETYAADVFAGEVSSDD